MVQAEVVAELDIILVTAVLAVRLMILQAMVLTEVVEELQGLTAVTAVPVEKEELVVGIFIMLEMVGMAGTAMRLAGLVALEVLTP